VWPQRRLPELIDNADDVDRTRYKDRVLSGCATRRYGCEYDIDVGLDRLGVIASEASRVVPGKGDDDRVEGDEADRNSDRVNECSSAAVDSRDSSSSPLCDSLSSCTPTVHPDRYVGREYAIAAVMLEGAMRNDKDTGGQAVCERKEYSN